MPFAGLPNVGDYVPAVHTWAVHAIPTVPYANASRVYFWDSGAEMFPVGLVVSGGRMIRATDPELGELVAYTQQDLSGQELSAFMRLAVTRGRALETAAAAPSTAKENVNAAA